MEQINLTNTLAGLAAIQRCMAGEDILFTKLEIGDGILTNNDVSGMTGLINKTSEFPLGAIQTEDNEVIRLRSNISNKDINTDLVIREYGIYAKFGEEQEFLFAYLNVGESTTPLPNERIGRYELNRDFVLYIGNSLHVDFTSNGHLVYVAVNEYKDDMNRKGNVVGTIEDLKNSKHYKIGNIVEVMGFESSGDGAYHGRKISEADDGTGIQLANGLWANSTDKNISRKANNVLLFNNYDRIFYVAPSASGRGLTQEDPTNFKRIESYLQEMSKMANINCKITVQFESGVYNSDGLSHMIYVPSWNNTIENTLSFKGNFVLDNVEPTTILNGKLMGNKYMHGIFVQNFGSVYCENIKCINFSESDTPNVQTGTRGGLAFSGNGNGRIWTKNIWAYLCSWGGIVNQGVGRLLVQSGEIEYCRQGISTMFGTQNSIGYNSSENRVKIKNCVEAGLLFQSQANGHCDYVDFIDMKGRAFIMATSSECNIVDSSFTDCNIAVSAQSNSRFKDSGLTYTNVNVANEFFNGGYKEDVKVSPLSNYKDGGNQFTTPTLTETGVLASYTIQKNILKGRGKKYTIKGFGRVSIVNDMSRIGLGFSVGNKTIGYKTFNTATNGYINFEYELSLLNFSDAITKAQLRVNINSSVEPFYIDLRDVQLDLTNEIVINSTADVIGTAGITLLTQERFVQL